MACMSQMDLYLLFYKQTEYHIEIYRFNPEPPFVFYIIMFREFWFSFDNLPCGILICTLKFFRR